MARGRLGSSTTDMRYIRTGSLLQKHVKFPPCSFRLAPFFKQAASVSRVWHKKVDATRCSHPRATGLAAAAVAFAIAMTRAAGAGGCFWCVKRRLGRVAEQCCCGGLVLGTAAAARGLDEGGELGEQDPSAGAHRR